MGHKMSQHLGPSHSLVSASRDLLPHWELWNVVPSQGIHPLGGGSGAERHLWFEGDDFEHHLNSEEASEHHVENIHRIVEGSSLLIVLGEEIRW